MGASTTAKRGDARSASRQPSHLQREVIGILLIALGLLALLSLVSFSPGDPTLLGPSLSGPPSPSSTQNMIGTVGANLAGTLFWLVGGAAYLLPVLLIMVGVRSFMACTMTVTLRSASGALAAVIFLSGLCVPNEPA